MTAGGERARRFPLGAAATVAEFEDDPFPLLARLREHEPVSWLPELGGWLVTRRDLAEVVLRDARTYTVDDPRFSTARIVGPSMLSLDGHEHARHRAAFVGIFRSAATGSTAVDLVAGEASRLVDAFALRGHADLCSELAAPLAASTALRTCGLDGVEVRTVLCWYRAIAASVSAITVGEQPSAESRSAVAELGEAVERSIRQLPCSPLGRVASGGELSTGEVIANVAVALFGAIETTEALIANAFVHVLGDVEQCARLRAQPELGAKAVEESLRLEPAAALVDRYATAPAEIGGAYVRTRDLVRVSLSAANRDPEVFPEPDRFDDGRDNARAHLTFAVGPHACPGASVARVEAVTALRIALERLDGLCLDPLRPSRVRGLVFRKPATLHVLFGPSRAG